MRTLFRLSRSLLPGALVAMATCCAGTTVERFGLQPTDQVTVTYTNSGTHLLLRNQSSLSAQKAYSRPGGNLNLKVASDDAMDRLLTGLKELGFFDGATGQVHPSAKASLAVQINHQTFVRSRLPLAMLNSVDDVQKFSNYVAVFRLVYDKTIGYHSVRGVTADDLQKMDRKLEDENNRRLRGLK